MLKPEVKSVGIVNSGIVVSCINCFIKPLSLSGHFMVLKYLHLRYVFSFDILDSLIFCSSPKDAG